MDVDPNQEQPESEQTYTDPNFYNAPAAEQYTPQQGEYGAPPHSSQNGAYRPYGPPPQQQQGYGYAPPAVAPLPLKEALRQLPSQYIKVVTKPSAATFAAEMGKAAGNIFWIQLLALALIAAVFEFLVVLINPFQSLLPTSSTNVSPQMPPLIMALISSLGEMVSVPLGVFIGVGIYYVIAKAFGGSGTLLAQGYTYLLIQVPLAVPSSLLYLVGFTLVSIPAVGLLVRLIGLLVLLALFVLSIYAVILNIFSLMAVHRLSGGKATAVVLLPIAVVFVILFTILFAALKTMHP